MRTPVDFEREIGESNDPAQLRMVGLACTAMGAATLLLLLGPDAGRRWWAVLWVAGVVGGVGVAFVVLARKKRQEHERWRAEHVPDRALDGARLVHFGYPPAMQAVCVDDGAPLIRLFKRARKRGAMTSLEMCGIDPTTWAGSTDWPSLLANVLPWVDVFLPSRDKLLPWRWRWRKSRGACSIWAATSWSSRKASGG